MRPLIGARELRLAPGKGATKPWMSLKLADLPSQPDHQHLSGRPNKAAGRPGHLAMQPLSIRAQVMYVPRALICLDGEGWATDARPPVQHTRPGQMTRGRAREGTRCCNLGCGGDAQPTAWESMPTTMARALTTLDDRESNIPDGRSLPAGRHLPARTGNSHGAARFPPARRVACWLGRPRDLGLDGAGEQ